MKKFGAAILLIMAPAAAFSQALEIRPIPYEGPVAEQPGMLSSVADITNDLVVEIGFYIDSSKVDPRIEYRCSNYVASGNFLVDRYPSNYEGGFYMAVVGNGNLCWMDRPWYGPQAQWSTDVEFAVTPDECHDLKVTRTQGRLTIELDGVEVFTSAPGWWASETWTYDSQNGTIGIGREKNVGPSRLDPTSTSQFPGSISYFRENGRDLLANGTLTGGAYFGSDPCATPPPSSACQFDPNSVECACETNPHPACNSCPS